ncbi:MAG: hypothetical protein RIA63_04350 [Cyclobacteriaceae bacterium]
MPSFKIDDGALAGDVQKKFNSIFPYLKIEFLKASTRHSGLHTSRTTYLLSANEPIGTGGKDISIAPYTTVAQLKKMLLDALNLHTMIYRKSGSMWIETSLTEDWSLERQNNEAEQMGDPSI